jgi:glycosyltransferase involved in cell wall biosynthesis
MPRIVAAHQDVVLLVVGEGELRAELESLSNDLGIRAFVRFLGFRSDTAAVMSAIDVLVLPSLWEGFGLVLLEAMASRKPIVASQVSAIPEIVDNGRTGYLVQPRDYAGIAAALVRLIVAPDTRRAMGEDGRRRLESSFSVDRMAAEIEHIYDEALMTAPPRNSP